MRRQRTTLASWYRQASVEQAQHLAAIRAAHPTPIDAPQPHPGPVAVAPLPPIQPFPPAPAPVAQPSVVWGPPHYVQVAAPPAVQLRRQLGPRPLARAWLWFKLLALLGFLYALVLACVITTAATHLRNTPATSNPSPTSTMSTEGPR